MRQQKPPASFPSICVSSFSVSSLPASCYVRAGRYVLCMHGPPPAPLSHPSSGKEREPHQDGRQTTLSEFFLGASTEASLLQPLSSARHADRARHLSPGRDISDNRLIHAPCTCRRVHMCGRLRVSVCASRAVLCAALSFALHT